MVDRAHRDAGFFDDAGEGRGFEAVLGHDALGGVQHEFAGLHPAAVGGDVGADSHGSTVSDKLELTLQFIYCSVHSNS